MDESGAADLVNPDELLAQLAREEDAEDIAIWLQEERWLPAAAAEDIADRCRRI